MGPIEGEEVVTVLEYADLFSPIPDAAEWKGFRQFQAVADFETVIRNNFDSFDIAVVALQDVAVFGQVAGAWSSLQPVSVPMRRLKRPPSTISYRWNQS